MIAEAVRYLSVGPLPLIFCIFMLLFIGSFCIGGLLFEIRKKRNPDAASETSQRQLLLSSVFGLLGLLTAFTFGMALDRHEQRRDLIVQEANAVGNAMLSLKLLPPSERAKVLPSFKQYIALRQISSRTSAQMSAGHIAKSRHMGEKLIDDLSTTLNRMPPGSYSVSIVNNFNNLISTALMHDAISKSRLPGSVVTLLICAAIISCCVLGIALGDSRKNWVASTILLLSLIALSFVSILDLDRAHDGAIRISQEPMEYVAGTVQKFR